MDLKKCVLLHILLTTSFVGSYYVSTLSSDYPLNATCKLATPPLTFITGKITTSFPEINNTVTEDLWVGYYQALAGFEYIGCVRSNDLQNAYQNTLNIFTARKDIGSCVHNCQPFVGIKDTECYCLPNITSKQISNDDKCNVECDAKGIACGGDSHVSIYRINMQVDTTVNSSGLRTRCWRFEPHNKKFYWRNCSAPYSYRPLCYKDLAMQIGENRDNMMKAANECFKTNYIPTGYNNSNRTGLMGGELWTGVLYTEAILKVSEWNGNAALYGVLRKKDSEFVIEFDIGNRQLRALCEKDSSSSTENPSYTTIDLPSIPTEISSQSSTTSKSISGTSDANHIWSSQTSRSPELSDKRHISGTNVGIPVGVSVAIIVLVVSAIIVLIILKRRNLTTRKNDMELMKSKQMEGGPNNYTDIPDTEKDTFSNPNAIEENNAHTYHVLEKEQSNKGATGIKDMTTVQKESDYNYPDMTDFLQEKINNQSDILGNGQYAHTYFVLEEHKKDVNKGDGTYNVIGVISKTDDETNNVYNKLDDKNHATYDHLHDHIPGAVSKRHCSDNLYGTKGNGMVKPSGNQGSFFNHVSGVEESGTYDHVNNVSSGVTVSDNVYCEHKKS